MTSTEWKFHLLASLTRMLPVGAIFTLMFAYAGIGLLSIPAGIGSGFAFGLLVTLGDIAAVIQLERTNRPLKSSPVCQSFEVSAKRDEAFEVVLRTIQSESKSRIYRIAPKAGRIVFRQKNNWFWWGDFFAANVRGINGWSEIEISTTVVAGTGLLRSKRSFTFASRIKDLIQQSYGTTSRTAPPKERNVPPKKDAGILSVGGFVVTMLLSTLIVGGVTFLYFGYMDPDNPPELIAFCSAVATITLIVAAVSLYRKYVRR